MTLRLRCGADVPTARGRNAVGPTTGPPKRTAPDEAQRAGMRPTASQPPASCPTQYAQPARPTLFTFRPSASTTCRSVRAKPICPSNARWRTVLTKPPAAALRDLALATVRQQTVRPSAAPAPTGGAARLANVSEAADLPADPVPGHPAARVPDRGGPRPPGFAGPVRAVPCASAAVAHSPARVLHGP
jgi:hypothetical protein